MCEKKNFVTCYLRQQSALVRVQSPFQINNYIIAQVFLAHDPLEDRRTIDVIIRKFFLPHFKMKNFEN